MLIQLLLIMTWNETGQGADLTWSFILRRRVHGTIGPFLLLGKESSGDYDEDLLRRVRSLAAGAPRHIQPGAAAPSPAVGELRRPRVGDAARHHLRRRRRQCRRRRRGGAARRRLSARPRVGARRGSEPPRSCPVSREPCRPVPCPFDPCPCMPSAVRMHGGI